MKIFVLSLLLITTLFALTLLTGCDEGMKMMKPVMEESKPTEMKPEPPIVETPEPEVPEESEQPVVETPEPPAQETEVPPETPEQPVRPGEEPLPELEAWSQATNIALGTIRLMELRELEPQYKFGDSISEETEEVLVERTGLTWEQLKNLTDICLVESGDIVFVEKLKRFVAFTDVLANYLQLTLVHPEKTESEIVELFRGRCERREVSAEASVVIGGYHPEGLEDLQWEWEQVFNEDDEEEEAGEEEGDWTAPESAEEEELDQADGEGQE